MAQNRPAPRVHYQEETDQVSANGKLRFPTYGSIFLRVLALDGDARLSIDGGATFFTARVGLRLTVPVEFAFESVIIEDTSGGANDFTIGFGTAEIGDDRIVVVGTGTGGVIPVSDNGTTLSVDDGGGSLTVDVAAAGIRVVNATHDDLNANANLQVANADVANGNPVPVSDAGGSLTVDGAVTANKPGTHVEGSVAGHTNGAGDVALLAAAGAGVKNYLEDLILRETAAAAAVVTIKKGATKLFDVDLPASSTLTLNFKRGFRSGDNEAINIAVSAGTVDAYAAGYTGA